MTAANTTSARAEEGERNPRTDAGVLGAGKRTGAEASEHTAETGKHYDDCYIRSG